MREDGVVEPVLRVVADLYSEDPIVIRCQLNRTADPNVDYELRLKIDFTSLDEKQYHWLTDPDQTFESIFQSWREGNVTYYNVSVNASPKLERSIISCGAEYQPIQEMRRQHCYTKSVAVIIFQDYDPCDYPTASPVTTPITPPTNSTGEVLTTKWATSIPTPVATVTDSNSSPTPTNITTTLDTPSKIDTTTAYITLPTAAEISMEKDTFFSAVGIVVLVGIVLLLANFIQLYVIIKRRRVAATASDLPDKRGERNDNAFDPRDRRGIELEEVLENSMAKESG